MHRNMQSLQGAKAKTALHIVNKHVKMQIINLLITSVIAVIA